MGDRIPRRSFISADFPCHVMGGTLDTDFRSHSHEFAELVIVLGGESTHTIDGVPSRIGAGDVFVLQGQTEHGFIRPRALWHYNLMYDPAVMLAGAEGLRTLPGYQALFLLEPHYRRERRFRSHLRLPPESLRTVRGMLQELEHETQAKPPGWRQLVQASFLRLVVFLSRAYPEAAESAALAETAGLYRLAETLAYMETHFREPLTVDELAARAALSRRHFLRVFRHYQGTSPVDYLIRLRLQHAACLLERPGTRVGEAAHAAGFRDSNYFARQFGRVYGRSPRRRGPGGA